MMSTQVQKSSVEVTTCSIDQVHVERDLVKLAACVLDVETDDCVVQERNATIFQAVDILDCGFHRILSPPHQSGMRSSKCTKGWDWNY